MTFQHSICHGAPTSWCGTEPGRAHWRAGHVAKTVGGAAAEQLAEFDHIFLGGCHCVDEVARISGRHCSYLPPAADVLRFRCDGAGLLR
jgi:hypothetical protein